MWVEATKHGNIRLCLCSLHVQILGHEFDRISRHVNAPRAALYQAPSKSSFLIRVDIINRPTSCSETLGLASSTPNDEYVLA